MHSSVVFLQYVGRHYLNETLTHVMLREPQKPKMNWKDYVLGVFFSVLDNKVRKPLRTC